MLSHSAATNGPPRIIDPAVKAAGMRLERWARRTYYAALVSAVCAVLMATAVMMFVVDYLRFKSAMADGIHQAQQAARAHPFPGNR